MTPSFRRISARNLLEKLHESSQSFSASFRGVSPRNLAEKKKKNGLHELTRNLEEFTPRKFVFEIFCSRSEREKRAFFLGWSVGIHLKISCTSIDRS